MDAATHRLHDEILALSSARPPGTAESERLRLYRILVRALLAHDEARADVALTTLKALGELDDDSDE